MTKFGFLGFRLTSALIVFAGGWTFVGAPATAQADTIVPVDGSQFSGTINASFAYASPLGTSPVPYGATNNTIDSGWIWGVGDQFTVDFLAPTALDRLRVWSVYTEGQRGATWGISYSDDGTTFTHLTDFTYLTTVGGGVNDDLTARDDFAGWYQVSFNSPLDAHQYWRVSDEATLVSHSPRSAEIEFYEGTTASTPEPGTIVLAGFGLIAAIGASSRFAKA